MTADQAREKTAASVEAPVEKVNVMVQAWFTAIGDAASNGKRKVAETALALPRTPIPAGAKREP